MPGAATVAGTTTEIDLLAIDPRTFTRAAFWRESFADQPVEELVASVDDVAGGRLRGVLVGDSVDSVDAIEVNQARLPVTVQGRATSFPGMLGAGPMLVVGRDALAELYDGPANPIFVSDVNTELWLRGSDAEIEAAVAELELPQSQVLTARQVMDIPYIAATLDTFSVLQVLAVVAAILVLVGLLMYLEARQRSQLVAYGLSLRMGVSRRDHRMALGLEMGSMLLGALLVAAPAALGAALVMAPRLDALESIPPRLLISMPLVPLAVAALVLLAVTWISARTIERRASRRPLGEVLRLADE
jgi:putative ABC transport system permease protein